MFRKITLTALLSIYINGSSLNINSLGMGGVDIAIGSNSKSTLLNPANIPSTLDRFGVELLSSILMNSRSLKFIKRLSSNDYGDISELMNRNIGKSLNIIGDTILSIYASYGDSYRWLIGAYENVVGEFITHTGFGSIGAMESFVYRDSTLLGSLNLIRDDIRFGFNIRFVERYSTIKNYTIGEIVETDGILDYFDNRYTKSESGVAFDIGGIYHIDRFNIGVSLLNIGDTKFGEFGKDNSSSNIGISTKYSGTLFGVDYIDIFHGDIEESIRFGVSRELFRGLGVKSGVINGNLTVGLYYRYSTLNLSLSSYRGRYQLMVSNSW